MARAKTDIQSERHTDRQTHANTDSATYRLNQQVYKLQCTHGVKFMLKVVCKTTPATQLIHKAGLDYENMQLS